MRNLCWLMVLIFLLLSSCSNPDFFVGVTGVYLEDGAERQMPCDFVDVLIETKKEIEARYGKEISHKVLSIPIRLYPDYSLPRSEHNPSQYFNGLFEGGEIHVRILGPSIIKSALLHEQIDHGLCLYAFKDLNSYHKNESCKKEEKEITEQVSKKTVDLREKRCSNEYWR